MIWIWLWEISECEGGDVDAIVAKAKAHNVGVMVKTHDGETDHPNGPQALALIGALQAAGVPVRSWGYCYPNVDPARQAAAAARAGVDYIADVEAEWDGETAEAQAFVDALRAALPGKKLGYAPLPIISYHDGGQTYDHAQYGAFNQLDVACPQAYAGTGGRDAIGALEWTANEWQTAFPDGVNIEPAVYAADQAAAELRRAIGYVRTNARAFGQDGDVSVWSWQHMTAEHWNVVAEYTGLLPTTGDPNRPHVPPAQTTPPLYAGQSADVQVKVGAVVAFTGLWAYVDGFVYGRTVKRFAHTVGRWPVDAYPQAEDLTTEHADATPARWFLDVVP